MAKFIKRLIIAHIKRRIYRKLGNPYLFAEATDFVLNAPMKEWRKRLWYVRHTRCNIAQSNFSMLNEIISHQAS